MTKGRDLFGANTRNIELGGADMAYYLGISQPRLTRLAKDHGLPREVRGRRWVYPLKAVIEWLRARERSSSQSESEARAELAVATKEKVIEQTKQLRGETIDRVDLERILIDFAVFFSQAIQRIPDALTCDRATAEAVSVELNDIQTDIAKRLRFSFGDGSQDGGDFDSPPEADAPRMAANDADPAPGKPARKVAKPTGAVSRGRGGGRGRSASARRRARDASAKRKD